MHKILKAIYYRGTATMIALPQRETFQLLQSMRLPHITPEESEPVHRQPQKARVRRAQLRMLPRFRLVVGKETGVKEDLRAYPFYF